MEENIINIFMKSIWLNVLSMYIFLKINNYKKNKIKIGFFIVGISIISAVFYVYLKQKIDIVMAIFATCFIQIIAFKCIMKKTILSTTIGVIISDSIPYIFFSIAIVAEFPFQYILKIDNMIINIFIALVIESILIKILLNIKKIRNGLIFMQKSNEYIEIAIINVCVYIIVVYGLVGTSYEKVTKHIFFYFIILAICMFITIQKILVMYYKQKLIDDTINQYKQDIQEKDNEIKQLKNENLKISKINHEFYNRQKALEHLVKNTIVNSNFEVGEELNLLQEIEKLTKEHSKKVSETKVDVKLDNTGISEIDNMFEYMKDECRQNNIEFNLSINGNIHKLINNHISVSQLVTMIGDHIRDAIIAINFSNSNNRKILTILGNKNDYYELSIYDTGIEFEIETLLNLGINRVTTHEESGGSGIGFITTFETLQKTKGSLIIEEMGKISNSYTKAIKVRFDGKAEYRIKSYRAEEVKKCNKNKRNLIIEQY